MNWLAPLVEDSMLYKIAQADDQSRSAAEDFEMLKRIRDRLEIPVPIAKINTDALNIVRWSEPDNPQRGYVGRCRDGHLMRAFTCAILLLAAAEPGNIGYIHSENDTVIQLFLSAIAIGEEAPTHTITLMAWRLIQLLHPIVEEKERTFFGIALLFLLIRQYEHNPNPEAIAALVKWVLREEERVRQLDRQLPKEMRRKNFDYWLLGLTHFGQKHDAWKQAAQQFLFKLPKGLPPTVAEDIQLIGMCLAEKVG